MIQSLATLLAPTLPVIGGGRPTVAPIPGEGFADLLADAGGRTICLPPGAVGADAAPDAAPHAVVLPATTPARQDAAIPGKRLPQSPNEVPAPAVAVVAGRAAARVSTEQEGIASGTLDEDDGSSSEAPVADSPQPLAAPPPTLHPASPPKPERPSAVSPAFEPIVVASPDRAQVPSPPIGTSQPVAALPPSIASSVSVSPIVSPAPLRISNPTPGLLRPEASTQSVPGPLFPRVPVASALPKEQADLIVAPAVPADASAAATPVAGDVPTTPGSKPGDARPVPTPAGPIAAPTVPPPLRPAIHTPASEVARPASIRREIATTQALRARTNIAFAPGTAAPPPPVAAAPVPAPSPVDLLLTEPAQPAAPPPLPAAPVEASQPLQSAAAAAAPLDPRDDQWVSAMIDRIETLRDAGGQRELRIRLTPDALGGVEVRLRETAEGMQVQLSADTPAARALLADAAPRLNEMAEARGVRLAQQGAESGAGQQGQPRHDDAPRSNRRAPASTASADLGTANDDERIA